MLTAFALSWSQLFERDLRTPLVKTLLWTVAAFILFWAAAFHELGRMAWGDSSLAVIGGVVLAGIILATTWLLFSLVENVILLCFADDIVTAVARRHYPDLLAFDRARAGRLFWRGLWLGTLAVLWNILALPVYLLVPGANLILFLGVNGYFLGRGYFDVVAVRWLDDREIRRSWASGRFGHVLNGVISMALASVPIVNLVAPIVGLATAVHLVARAQDIRDGSTPLGPKPGGSLASSRPHSLTIED